MTFSMWMLLIGTGVAQADHHESPEATRDAVQLAEPLAEAPASTAAYAASPTAYVHQDNQGQQLIYRGEPYLVRGMNWGYMPIGQNYSYDFWGQPDAFIEEVLHREMTLLRAMGVNSIRQYDVIPPRWVSWIYENYGISARLTYNWRDTFLSNNSRGASRNPVFVNAYDQVDLNVSYDITDAISVSFEAINLTGSNVETFARTSNQPWFIVDGRPRYYAGARFRF